MIYLRSQIWEGNPEPAMSAIHIPLASTRRSQKVARVPGTMSRRGLVELSSPVDPVSTFSNCHRLAILTPDAPQAMADLAHGSECFDTIEHAWQDVLSPARGCFQLDQCSFTGVGVAPLAQGAYPLNLSFLDSGIDAQSLYTRVLVVLKLIHAHNNRIIGLDCALILVSRILNLALDIA